MSISSSAITASPAPASPAVRTTDASETAHSSAGSVAPSSTVTLSADAKVYADMAARGIAVPQPNSMSGKDLARFAKQLAGAGATDGQQAVGGVSEDGSTDAASQFGASKEQADKVFKALDANSSHTISHAELLNALSKTVTSLSADATQALLNLINTNGDANINSAELVKFETSFVAAEKPTK